MNYNAVYIGMDVHKESFLLLLCHEKATEDISISVAFTIISSFPFVYSPYAQAPTRLPAFSFPGNVP